METISQPQEQVQQPQPDPKRDLFDLEEVNDHMEAIEYLTSRVISTEDSDYKGKLALQLNEAYRLFYCKVNTKFRLLYKHITPEIKEEYEKYAAKTKEVDNPNLYSKEAADQVFTFLTRLIMYVDNPLNHYRGIRNGL